jgi:hypothetical protein
MDLLDEHAKNAQNFYDKALAPFITVRKGSAWLEVVKKGDQVLGKRSLSFNMSDGNMWLADENDFHKGLPSIAEVGKPFEDYNLNSKEGSLQMHGSFQEDDEDMKDFAKAIEDLESSLGKLSDSRGLQKQNDEVIDHNDLEIVVTDQQVGPNNYQFPNSRSPMKKKSSFATLNFNDGSSQEVAREPQDPIKP